MKYPKAIMIMVASLVLTMLLGLAGCGDDHRGRHHGDRDREHERYERRDGDRHEDRDGDSRHERSGRDDR